MNGEQLTLLPEASLASLSVWPGSKQAKEMTVTSGRRCIAFLKSCDPASASLRTLVGSSIWRSTMCLLTWHHKTTPQGRSYYRLRVSVPPIAEIASGLLHMPTAMANQNAPSMRDRDAGSWFLPTPGVPGGGRSHWPEGTEIRGRNGYTPSGRKVQINLEHIAEGTMFPTPDASPHKYRLQGDSQQSNSLNGIARGKLNPDWVSRMMGFPDGWMDVGEETP